MVVIEITVAMEVAHRHQRGRDRRFVLTEGHKAADELCAPPWPSSADDDALQTDRPAHRSTAQRASSVRSG
jgi:hypothetical protein